MSVCCSQLSQVFILFFLGGSVLLLVMYFWKHRKILALARKLPTAVPTVPVLGHAYLIIHGSIGMTNLMFKIGKEFAARSANVFVLWLGPYPVFKLFGTEDIQTVLRSEKALDIGPEANFAKFGLGNGLVTAPASIWKITRRHINPVFYPKNLELLLPKMNECGRDLTHSLSEHVEKGLVDVLHDLGVVVLKSSVHLVFGPDVKVNVNSEAFKKIMWAVPRINEITANRFKKIWLWPESWFQFLYKKEIQEIDTSIKNFLKEPMKMAEKNSEKEERIEHDSEKGDGRGQLTLPEAYKIMRKSYSNFTDLDLQQEIVTMFAAGSDTTKSTIGSCLLSLAANPQIQERLFKEITSVVPGQTSDVTMEDLKAMPYLDQVLKETLRKFMTIPVLMRSLNDDLKLSFSTVPAGATVSITIYGVHFNPRYYPDPEKFDPDRFSSENVAERDKYTFVAFGGGPRNCIGKTYAMMVMKVLVVHVIRNYELTTTVDIDNLTYISGVATLSADGYKMELKRRQPY